MENFAQLNDNIEILIGASELEIAGQRQFRWFSKQVKIKIVSKSGLLLIQGQSPVNNKIKITTPQVSFDIILFAGQDKEINIPIASANGKHDVLLEFSHALEVPAETRKLCFQVFQLQWKTLPLPKSVEANEIPQVKGQGLLSGQILTTFSMGWLRMTVRRTNKNDLHISGILAPPSQRREAALLTANGNPLDDIEYNLFNPDYDYLGNVAFEGKIDLRLFHKTNQIRFSTEYLNDGTPVVPWYQDWIYPTHDSILPLPESKNMHRIGSSETDWFLFSGASFVSKLPDVLQQFSNNSCIQELNVLDWGCGCGRLTRHLLNIGYNDVIGIDIDPVNIAWCQENLAGAEFQLVNPDPPTTLPNGHYDLILGHSVFTHLTELDQFLWLAEINRLLKPGGLAVVTFMGNFSTAIDPFTSTQYIALLQEGFLDVGWQEDGVDSQRPGYYRRVFHTVDYITKNWNQFLEVVSIMDGYSDHQTAVVLRKQSV